MNCTVAWLIRRRQDFRWRWISHAIRLFINYGIMGPIKAALESSVRYMASELGAIRAGSGITDFDGLMDDAVTRSPLHRLGKPEDVGRLTAFLISDWAASQTGSQMFVDAGHHIMA
ncbi:MAG: SDR family oxidoreductase [Oleispira sp.]